MESASAEPALPMPFEDLAPFLDWALETERARIEKKVTASMGEVRSFYDAMMPRLKEILDYLESCFDQEMTPPDRRLFLLSLSLVEVSSLVELYRQRESIEACDPLRFLQF